MSALKLGTGLLAMSGLLYLLAFALAGFSPGIISFAVSGAVFLILAWYLSKSGMRWLVWGVFLGVMVTSTCALSHLGSGRVPN